MRYLFEDYVLDTERRELRHRADLVPVEPQVFDLLAFLIGNRERVLSKDDLLAAIWGGRVVSETALTSRINSARCAIGDSGHQQRLIKTLPRKGVRFIGAVREQANAAEPSAGESQKPSAAFRDRPSIAVLPFTNIGADPEQEYFADGLTDDLITALSQWRSFPVVARNSTFAFKGKPMEAREAARALGAHYVVEGSIRKAGTRVRVIVQLVDGTTGNQFWADRFDRNLVDIFEVQDELTHRITAVIAPELTSTRYLK
jgi:TolB-like protein